MSIGFSMKKRVFSISVDATIGEAASKMVTHHVGVLPVIDGDEKVVGVIGLPDLVALELPAFYNLITDLDFISDFGAVERTFVTRETLERPLRTLMQPTHCVQEDSGTLHAYAVMLKYNLSDLPVVSKEGKLVGIVSRVDIGVSILSKWKEIGEKAS